jgi:oligopeptide transport system permease protein
VLGRDIWTRTWIGTRISLYIALVAVAVDMLFD